MAKPTNPYYTNLSPDASGYWLHEDAFTQELRDDIEQQTGLVIGSLGDWWVFPSWKGTGNPILTWPELLTLALHILHCEATRLFAESLYLKVIPPVTIVPESQPVVFHVSGAKRVNADSGDYTDFSDYVGMAAIGKILRGEENRIEDAPRIQNSQERFRLSGKDDSCMVEGSWWDWCCFAANVLASENTKVMAPDLYEPALKNENY